MSIYSRDYKYLIKITKKEETKIDNENFTVIVDKIVCQSKIRFKEEFKKLGKYQNSNYKITTYQNIRGRWYECTKPKI